MKKLTIHGTGISDSDVVPSQAFNTIEVSGEFNDNDGTLKISETSYTWLRKDKVYDMLSDLKRMDRDDTAQIGEVTLNKDQVDQLIEHLQIVCDSKNS